MPELPEVEIIRQELSPQLENLTVSQTYTKNITLRSKLLPSLSALQGQSLLEVKRRNKYLIFIFSSHTVLVHLGMTGQLILQDKVSSNKHCHWWIKIGDLYLNYIDPRRFGALSIYSNKTDLSQTKELKELGLEPLDATFTLKAFNDMVKSTNKEAKKFLMDAHYVCGIGNIYACEILFETKVSPFKLTKKWTKKDIQAVHAQIATTLKKAISLGGSTISDFVHTNGQSGQMQDFYKVYNRAGLSCFVCNNKIEKAPQGGRTTYFCKTCQKA